VKNAFTPKNKKVSNESILTPSKGNRLKFNLLQKLNDSKTNEDSETFDYEEEKSIELSTEEKIVYGNREPRNYKKIRILGKYIAFNNRGGCGIVFLCKDNKDNEYAVKQIVKGKELSSMNTIIAKREVEVVQHLMNVNNCSEEEEENNYLVRLIDYIEDSNDIWIVFQKAGKSLASLAFKIKGEFLANERIYNIKKGKFLIEIFENIKNFKLLLKKLLEFIDYLQNNGVIHCDLKPDNILIEYAYDSNNEFYIKELKVIDFGSAFFISNPEKFSSNTPEYMSPEINDLLEKKSNTKDFLQLLKNIQKYPWCIDIWSLGVSILEIVLSCPLWMSYKAKVVIQGKVQLK
jgi:serine/threonine protein kinase